MATKTKQPRSKHTEGGAFEKRLDALFFPSEQVLESMREQSDDAIEERHKKAGDA